MHQRLQVVLRPSQVRSCARECPSHLVNRNHRCTCSQVGATAPDDVPHWSPHAKSTRHPPRSSSEILTKDQELPVGVSVHTSITYLHLLTGCTVYSLPPFLTHLFYDCHLPLGPPQSLLALQADASSILVPTNFDLVHYIQCAWR